MVPDCDCEIYRKDNDRGGPCLNCGHYPAKHKKLGKMPYSEDNGAVAKAEIKAQQSPAASVKDGSLADIASEFQKNTRGHELAHTWEVDAKELKFTKRLGEGTSAKVFRGIYRGQEVAIKVLKEKVNTKDMDGFMKEFAIMRY